MTLCDNYFYSSLGLIEKFPVKTAALPVMAVFFLYRYIWQVSGLLRYIKLVYIYSPLPSLILSLFVYILDIAWFPLAYRNSGHVKFYIDFVSCYFWDYCEQLFGQNKKHVFIYLYIIFLRLFMVAIPTHTHRNVFD